ncbi:MAG TPA: PQQ-dependent sugar dehydrogenase [Ignavibacteria bacterium]|nr:PQQ-dependent sugar dehydrogenase [Ignavibacteria bacterium]
MKKIYYLLFCLMMGGIFTNSYAQPLAVQNAFPGMSNFTQPIFLTHAGDATNRIFVAQKNGLILVFPNDSTATGRQTFLNISNKIVTGSGGDERGLLGLAFHPDYANNGYFYVNYTAPSPLRTVISRFSVMPGNPNKADSLSEFIIMEIPQPFTNHNGGMIFFGLDNYLYIGTGDGGSSGDPGNRAQTITNVLGKVLRIDIDTIVAPNNYGIPPTNIYADTGAGAKEIFAIGMRNPWRMSQDHVTGHIYAGDVGQGSWEEIDIIENGKNYGWRCYEGNNPYNTAGCGPQGNYTFPISVYGSNSPDCSVTGGYVYRGTRRPELVGRYLYSDYCSGRLRKLYYNNGTVTEESILLTLADVLSFGEDQNKELYMCGNDGVIYRFNMAVTGIGNDPNVIPAQFSLEQNYPNPFNPSTTIRYSLPSMSSVELVIYNTLGKEIKSLVSTTQQAGSYERQWDGRDNSGKVAASGVYFYTLRTNSFTETKRMLLVK